MKIGYVIRSINEAACNDVPEYGFIGIYGITKSPRSAIVYETSKEALESIKVLTKNKKYKKARNQYSIRKCRYIISDRFKSGRNPNELFKFDTVELTKYDKIDFLYNL